MNNEIKEFTEKYGDCSGIVFCIGRERLYSMMTSDVSVIHLFDGEYEIEHNFAYMKKVTDDNIDPEVVTEIFKGEI